MDPIVLEPETLRYWSFIKDANFNVKNALISLLWKSMSEMLTLGKESKSEQISEKQRLNNIAEIRQRKEEELWSKMPIIKKEDVKISQWAMDIVKDVPQIAENTDYDKVKLNYIMQKYG